MDPACVPDPTDHNHREILLNAAALTDDVDLLRDVKARAGCTGVVLYGAGERHVV